MKTTNYITAALAIASATVQAELKPTVWADIPDVAPLRVGDTYYMTSTTMHFNPGVPVMESKDLVDWKIAGYCYDTIENRAKDRLDDGDDYGHGTWASSMRYNEADGLFYVSSFNVAAGHTYLFSAKDPAGPWTKRVLDKLIYDHSLWIENGKFWFFASEGGKCRLYRVKDDLSGIEKESKLVCPSINNNLGPGLAEGSQVFKRGEWYYLVNICWPRGRCRLVNVHRAKSIEGPFVEARVAFEHEGIAQGSFIDRPDGSWVAVLFGDRGGVGRIPFVLPVEWTDDGWPVVKPENDFKGDFTKVPSCVASDDFASGRLDLAWQWNHNPDNANWKIEDGKFKITTSRVDSNLLSVKNTLTQRTFGPKCEATVVVDGSAMKPGDKAGLSLFQHLWGAISLAKTEKGFEVVVDQPDIPEKDRHMTWLNKMPRYAKNNTAERVRRAVNGSTIHLKAVCDFSTPDVPGFSGIPVAEDSGRFYYSEDGVKWEPLGDTMFLPYTIPHFTGWRFALFNMSTKAAGGTAAFDDFKVAVPSK